MHEDKAKMDKEKEKEYSKKLSYYGKKEKYVDS